MNKLENSEELLKIKQNLLDLLAELRHDYSQLNQKEYNKMLYQQKVRALQVTQQVLMQVDKLVKEK